MIKQFINNLPQSDRRALSIAAVVLLCFTFYLFIWVPAYEGVAQNQLRYQRQADLLAWLKPMLKEVNSLSSRSGSVQAIAGSLLTWVQQSLTQAGLKKYIKQIQPKDRQALQVSLLNLPYKALMTWLIKLEHQKAVSIVKIRIKAKGEGLVDASLQISRVIK